MPLVMTSRLKADRLVYASLALDVVEGILACI